MNRRSNRTCWRTFAALCLGLLVFSIAASDPNPAENRELRFKMSALLRIEIEYLDDQDKKKPLPAEDRIIGHGVYVSAKGLILTASHVLYPNLDHFQSEGASDYQVAVRAYLTRRLTGGGEVAYMSSAKTFSSNDIARQSKHSLEDRFIEKCKAGGEAICLKSKPSETNDIAVFATKQEDTPYIGLSGPKERIARLVQWRGPNLSIGVLSDFDSNDSISFSPVLYRNDNEYETSFPQDYREGVSGSPVVVNTNSDTLFDTLFIIGIVVQAPASANQMVKVASKNNLPDIQSSRELIESLGVSADSSYQGWRCFIDSGYPRPNPLHGDYLALKLSIESADYSNILDPEDTGELLDCGLSTYGWQDSFEDINEDINEQMNTTP